MNKPVRRAELSVAYNSTDISTDIAPMLESFDYEDVVDGKTSDNIGIGVDNKDGRWYGDWLPDRGATLEATLTCRDWPGTKILKCGIFEIDDIDFGAVPNVCTISAVSVGISSAIRREEKTKPWESIDLRTIAAEIAGKHGFGLEYDSGINPQYERRDQREQTDLQFLISLLDDNGLAIEIAQILNILRHEDIEAVIGQEGAHPFIYLVFTGDQSLHAVTLLGAAQPPSRQGRQPGPVFCCQAGWISWFSASLLRSRLFFCRLLSVPAL